MRWYPWSQEGVLVFGLQALPAALHLGLDRRERRLVAGLAQVLGLAHQLQPVGDRQAPPDRIGVVGDARDATLDLVKREEAGVDGGLDDVDADTVLGLPVQGTGDQHLS